MVEDLKGAPKGSVVILHGTWCVVWVFVACGERQHFMHEKVNINKKPFHSINK